MIANANKTSGTEVELSDHEVTITRDDRRYRVRGLAKNTSWDQLKINLMASRDGAMHIDTLDLYDARRRITFCKQAGPELFIDEATVKQDLGHVLLQLEQLQQQTIEQSQADNRDKPYQMTDAEKQEALKLLEAPDLRLRHLRYCRRADEQARRLLSRDQPQAATSTGHRRTIFFRCWQVVAHGRCPVLHSARRSSPRLSHDRSILVLHGVKWLETQGVGHCRGRWSRTSGLRRLRPLLVINPYADQLTFIDHQTRNRRSHTKNISLFRVAFIGLRQIRN